jgi:hypothetical protein
MDDDQILARIGELVAREHHLEAEHGARALTAEERAELTGLEVALDQAWDLLRQRRARREFGQNPDDTHLRPAETVESYEQ